jgi:hypothetical protein
MILLAGGWIANLVKLISVATDQGVTAMFVLRLIGLVAWPIGIILGFV